ncbi:MAG: hypothetical protein H6599_05610 [Flavobacteriales bacterium]|nr:hypothetical protein [Flavobacteriales bacterium]
MLNRFITTCLLAFFHLIFFGQEVVWTEATSLSGFGVSKAFSTKDSTIYIIKQSKERPMELLIDLFSYDLNKKLSSQISVEGNEINQISFFNNSLQVFAVEHLGKEDELFVYHYDSLCKLIEKKSLLKCKAYGGYHSYFDVSVSPDQKYCAVIGSDGYSPEQKEIIHAALYDTLWKEAYQKEIPTSILSQKKSYNAITVNDNGVTYILKRERKKSADQYYVYCVSKNGSETHHNLHLKARDIIDMRYELDSIGDLYLGGFYAPPYKSLYEGFYIKKLNSEGTEFFSKEYMFNENVINAFNSKKDIKDFGYGLRKFHASHFEFINDKNLVLEAEHITKNKNKSGEMTHVQDGFVLISLSAKGGFQFATPVHTSQTDESHDGYWSSHSHVSYKGQDLLFLNILGEGSKNVKESLPKNAIYHTYKITFDVNGVEKRELQEFNVNLENYALYSDFINRSNLPLLIVKSKDKDQYAIGLLKE